MHNNILALADTIAFKETIKYVQLLVCEGKIVLVSRSEVRINTGKVKPFGIYNIRKELIGNFAVNTASPHAGIDIQMKLHCIWCVGKIFLDVLGRFE